MLTVNLQFSSSKSVPLHSSLPAYILTGKKECTPTLLLSRLLLILEKKSIPLHSSLPTINWQERVYPCTFLFPILTGQKECTPTLFLSRYTGRKECTPTLFPPSNMRALTFLYLHTILTPNFPSNTGRKECTPTLFTAS